MPDPKDRVPVAPEASDGIGSGTGKPEPIAEKAKAERAESQVGSLGGMPRANKQAGSLGGMPRANDQEPGAGAASQEPVAGSGESGDDERGARSRDAFAARSGDAFAARSGDAFAARGVTDGQKPDRHPLRRAPSLGDASRRRPSAVLHRTAAYL